MKRRRTPDVIDVNKEWKVYSGTRMCGRWVGTVLGHDYPAARCAVAERWPDMGRFWIEDKAIDDARIDRDLAARNKRGRKTDPNNLPIDRRPPSDAPG